jgi:uncharacterized protein GlcG (DUF336 family)
MRKIVGPILMGLVLQEGTVVADELPREAVLPLTMASKAASAALEKCAKEGYRVSVAVVDRAGVLRAQLRGDGAGPHTVDSSRKKAYTAASLQRPTSELAELIVRTPAVQAMSEMNENILMLGGGLPIEIGGETVGAIGVGGAPGAQLDQDCAKSGVDLAVGERCVRRRTLAPSPSRLTV